MTDPTLPPLLDATRAAFLGGPLGINLASRAPDLRPSLARGYGCRVAADRRAVTLFVAARRADALLRDLAAGAPLAVIFSRPLSHESLQLKGASAAIEPLAAGDRDRMRDYAAAFSAEICALGYDLDFARALLAAVEEEALAVRFRPTAAFEQTPGPKAGEPLGPPR